MRVVQELKMLSLVKSFRLLDPVVSPQEDRVEEDEDDDDPETFGINVDSPDNDQRRMLVVGKDQHPPARIRQIRCIRSDPPMDPLSGLR